MTYAGKRRVYEPAPVQAALDTLDQGVAVFDGELRLVALNRRFVELLRLPAELAGGDRVYRRAAPAALRQSPLRRAVRPHGAGGDGPSRARALRSQGARGVVAAYREGLCRRAADLRAPLHRARRQERDLAQHPHS